MRKVSVALIVGCLVFGFLSGPRVSAADMIFSDDFESGAPGWTATGFWHLEADSAPCPNSHSATHSFYYGKDDSCDYDSGARNSGTLTSPSIDLTRQTGATLTFWTWWEIEAMDPHIFDLMRIQVNSTTVLQLNPTIDPSDSQGYYSSAGYNTPGIWVQHTVDLSAYDGNTITITFFFDTGDSQYNYPQGWYVDDIQVTGNKVAKKANPQLPSMLPTAQNHISEGKDLLAQANELLSQAQGKGLDTGECQKMIDEAGALLEQAKKTLTNPINANNLALQAIEKLKQAIECLKALLG